MAILERWPFFFRMGCGDGHSRRRMARNFERPPRLAHHPSNTFVPGKLWLAGVYPSFFSISPVPLLEKFAPVDGKMKLIAAFEKGDKDQNYLELIDGKEPDKSKVYLLTMSTPDRSLLADLIYPLDKSGENYEKLDGNNIYKGRIKQSIGKLSETPGFFFTGISGMYDQLIYMNDNRIFSVKIMRLNGEITYISTENHQFLRFSCFSDPKELKTSL